MITPPSPGPASNPEESKEKKPSQNIRKGVKNLNLAALGWNFAIAPLVGGTLGYGVDRLTGFYPWGMIVGLMLGFVSAFIEVLRGIR